MEIEVIPFTLAGRRPAHLPNLSGRADAGHPQDAALGLLASAGLRPLLVHSTSWRHDGERLTLTYAAVVDADSDQAEPVWPVELARGGPLHAPAAIDEEQVAMHALVHLAWLAGHDPIVAAALPPRWLDALRSYSATGAGEAVAV